MYIEVKKLNKNYGNADNVVRVLCLRSAGIWMKSPAGAA